MSDIPTPETWDDAFKAARSHCGMGSLQVIFNPYTNQWKAEINFSDGNRYQNYHHDINIALTKSTHQVYDKPPNV